MKPLLIKCIEKNVREFNGDGIITIEGRTTESTYNNVYIRMHGSCGAVFKRIAPENNFDFIIMKKQSVKRQKKNIRGVK